MSFRKCISPGVPFSLELEDGRGKFIESFILGFDFNALAAIKEKTGLNVLSSKAWQQIDDPKVLQAFFWGAVILHQPDYNCAEGFEVIGSYINTQERQEKVLDAVWAAYRAFLSEDKRKRLPESLVRAAKDGAKDAVSPDPTQASPVVNSVGSTSGPSPVTTSASVTASSAL